MESDESDKSDKSITKPSSPPWWQQIIGIVLGTAVGGVIYGIFLQALLFQSLVMDRKPLDPAEWREKLYGKAWICGILSFLTMLFVPFKFIQRDTGATVISDETGKETGIAWFLIAMILIVQLATVFYAMMRKELCNVEHPSDIFEYFPVSSKNFSCSSSRRNRPRQNQPMIDHRGNPLSRNPNAPRGTSDLHSSHRMVTNPFQNNIPIKIVTSQKITNSSPNTLLLSESADDENVLRKVPLLRLTYSLTLWKNWVQILIILIEFVQLFSMGLDGGQVLRSAGVNLLPDLFLDSFTVMKNIVWQFGMDNNDPDSFITGFGILTGFSGLYIILCGVFIALDLTVDSILAPLQFTILAGGFFCSITSGLLFLILYSQESLHVIVGLIMLAYYSSTAVFVSIYRSDLKKTDHGEIRVIPVFIAIERVSKGILAALSVAISPSNLSAKPALVASFGVYLSLLILFMKPYSVFDISALRLTSLLICSWTGLITFIASFLTASTSYSSVLLTFLILGWCTIVLGTFRFSKSNLDKMENEHRRETMESIHHYNTLYRSKEDADSGGVFPSELSSFSKHGESSTSLFLSSLPKPIPVATTIPPQESPHRELTATKNTVTMDAKSDYFHRDTVEKFISEFISDERGSSTVTRQPLPLPVVPEEFAKITQPYSETTGPSFPIEISSSTPMVHVPMNTMNPLLGMEQRTPNILSSVETSVPVQDQQPPQFVPYINNDDDVVSESIPVIEKNMDSISYHNEPVEKGQDNSFETLSGIVWIQHQDDEGDVWYSRADGIGESVWELPPGAMVIPFTT